MSEKENKKTINGKDISTIDWGECKIHLGSGGTPTVHYATKEEADKEENDPKVNPDHYKHGGLETWDILRAILTPEEFRGFLKGNIIKYRDRAAYKGEAATDYKKAKAYYEKLTEGDEE